MIDLNHQQISNRGLAGEEGIMPVEIIKWFGLFALIVVFLFCSVSFRNQILAVQYEIQELKRDNQKLVDQNDLLRAELKGLVRPVYLEVEAGKLGLVNPNQKGILTLEADRFRQLTPALAQSRSHDNPVLQE
jgi:cell division protein FtsL